MSAVFPIAGLHREAQRVIDAMCLHLATVVGVTVQGTHVTVRFYDAEKRLLQVTMVICDVDDGSDYPEPDPDLEK